jgi:hypothetical protein
MFLHKVTNLGADLDRPVFGCFPARSTWDRVFVGALSRLTITGPVQWRTYTANFRLYVFIEIMIQTVILKPRIADERDS